MTTFTDGPNGPLQLDTPLGEEPLAVEETNDKLRVKVKLTSIIAVLNEDGFRLGTLSLSAADVSVMLRTPTMRVAASLGNLSFVDDFSSDGPLEMLSIQGDELADFQYETYDPLDLASYPGHDTLIYLRTGSLQLTFIEEPVHRLLTFFSKFARMKALYDAATQAAAQRATEISTTIQKMHYDILIRTPIVRFPHESDSMDLIVANLGEISLSNRFEVSDALVVTKITAGLRAIRLTSILHETSKPYSLQIIDDVDIGVDITLTQDVDDSKTTRTPATQVR
jgi:vacuolar protein sorting-associated protein 13A/C